MAFLLANDTISGQEARAYTIINGKNELMFYAKKLDATVKKTKVQVKTIGKRGTQHKTAGWVGTGKLEIYYATSLFRKLMLDYMKTGVDTSFDILVMNHDPSTQIGLQTIVLKNVNLDSVKMACFDVDTQILAESIDFSFEAVEMLDQFREPSLG